MISLKGDIYFNYGDYDSALKWYNKALRLNQNFINSLTGKGDSIFSQELKEDERKSEKYENALKAY